MTATRLWKRLEDYVFALGEIEVISGGVDRARRARVTALNSIEAGRWARANLVDGFDSRRACAAAADPVAHARRDCVYRLRQFEKERQRLAEALVEPSLRAEKEAASALAAEIDRQLQSLQKEAVVFGIQSHPPRPISVLRRGEVEQPGEPVGPGALACLPGLSGAFSLADAGQEASRARPWPSGSRARPTC